MSKRTFSWRPVYLAAALLGVGGIATADSFVTAPAFDINLGGSIWASASSTPTDAFFAGAVYLDMMRNGCAYDRNTLWAGFFADIYIAETYGSPAVENLASVIGRSPRSVTSPDHLLDQFIRQAETATSDPADWVATAPYDGLSGDATDD